MPVSTAYWDVAYALTEGREGINPRPLEQARDFPPATAIYERLDHLLRGMQRRRQQGDLERVGVGPGRRISQTSCATTAGTLSPIGTPRSFAQGLLSLERNWQGPLQTNEAVVTTLQQFQAMDRDATPQMRRNWRFQQALYRAYYDAYVRRRLNYEQELEERAMDRLRGAARTGAIAAMSEAEEVLSLAVSQPVAADLRARVFELGEALFQSIHMQFSVARYQAIAVERGANLDTIDAPLNNRVWLKAQFARIRGLPDEAERRREIERIVHWTDPGLRLLRRAGQSAAPRAPRSRPWLRARSRLLRIRPDRLLEPGRAHRLETARRNAVRYAAGDALQPPGPACRVQTPRRLRR